MASRFSPSDVAELSRQQKIEALGIAIRLMAGRVEWQKTGEVMTDQECLDEAIAYELAPSATSPQARFRLVEGWEEDESLNPYRWRSRSWVYRFWKVDPLPTSPEFAPIRRAKPWNLDPEWDVPWPHEPGRPDLPLDPGREMSANAEAQAGGEPARRFWVYILGAAAAAFLVGYRRNRKT